MFRQKIQVRERSNAPSAASSSASAVIAKKTIQPQPPVYSLTDFQKGAKLMINNIVQLKLLSADINKLESEIANCQPIGEPEYFDLQAPSQAANTIEPAQEHGVAGSKKMSRVLKPLQLERAASSPKQERKDLIINSGVRRKFQPLLQLYANSWPTHTPYACWYDCHKFDTTPVGIPQMMVDDTFYCYGNFCSYNCAMRYLLPDDEDDFAQLQTTTDRFVKDDLSDKIQLLELLCHMETGLDFAESIKLAPKRLTLQLFGGVKSIDEFRNNFTTHTTYHMFRSPMVPISYQMEECSGQAIMGENVRNGRRSVIDVSKLERAYKALLNERKDGAVLQKLLKNKQQTS